MRKTAALCVAKLYDVNPELVVNQVQHAAFWLSRSLAFTALSCAALTLFDGAPFNTPCLSFPLSSLFLTSLSSLSSQGFLDLLIGLLSDSNPTVVANAVATLSEIDEMSGREVFKINSANVSKLLAALNECTEYDARTSLSLASFLSCTFCFIFCVFRHC